MKIKLIKIFTCFLIMCMCLLAFQIKPKAQSSNTTFEPFEVGMIFPFGYELTENNVLGTEATKMYLFRTSFNYDNTDYVVETSIWWNGVYHQNDNVNEYGATLDNSVVIGYSYQDTTDYTLLVPNELTSEIVFELIDILDVVGTGELGIYTENIFEPNVIYNGTYELLANLIYGTHENLTSSQVGTLEFISMLITIMCVLLPFIILFFIVRKLCN